MKASIPRMPIALVIIAIIAALSAVVLASPMPVKNPKAIAVLNSVYEKISSKNPDFVPLTKTKESKTKEPETTTFTPTTTPTSSFSTTTIFETTTSTPESTTTTYTDSTTTTAGTVVIVPTDV